MFDILNNHRIEIMLSVQQKSAGDAVNYPSDNGFDLWENNQLPNRALIIVDVQTVATGGSLILIVQDSTDQSTWDEDYITCETIDEAGLYFIDVNDPYRYIRLNGDVDDAAVTWGAYLITFEDQRRPVTQSGSTLTLTYGTGRTPKVASS